MSFTKVLALCTLAISGTMAADVYATFYSENGQISPNFDVSNEGCFAADQAMSVSFSQSGGSSFNGPYCLSAFTSGGCPGSASATQQFSSLSSGQEYALNGNVAFSASYKWAPNAC